MSVTERTLRLRWWMRRSCASLVRGIPDGGESRGDCTPDFRRAQTTSGARPLGKGPVFWALNLESASDQAPASADPGPACFEHLRAESAGALFPTCVKSAQRRIRSIVMANTVASAGESNVSSSIHHGNSRCQVGCRDAEAPMKEEEKRISL